MFYNPFNINNNDVNPTDDGLGYGQQVSVPYHNSMVYGYPQTPTYNQQTLYSLPMNNSQLLPQPIDRPLPPPMRFDNFQLPNPYDPFENVVAKTAPTEIEPEKEVDEKVNLSMVDAQRLAKKTGQKVKDILNSDDYNISGGMGGYGQGFNPLGTMYGNQYPLFGGTTDYYNHMLGKSIGFRPRQITNPDVSDPEKNRLRGMNIARGVFAGLGSALGSAKNVMAGMGDAKRRQYVTDRATEKERKALINMYNPYGQQMLFNNGYRQYYGIGYRDGGEHYLEDGGKIGIEQMLSGEKTTGVNPETETFNAEVEKGEFLIYPNGSITEVAGDTHEKGGEKMNLPNGTRVISDNVIVPKDDIKFFKNLGIPTRKNMTFAKLMNNVNKDIGMTEMNEEQEKFFKMIEKNNTVEDDTTKNRNLEYISKNIHSLEQQKQELGKLQNFFADLAFQKQELAKQSSNVKKKSDGEKSSKSKEFDGKMLHMGNGVSIPVFFENGGYFTDSVENNAKFQKWAEKKGFNSMEQVNSYFQDGGEKEVYENLGNQKVEGYGEKEIYEKFGDYTVGGDGNNDAYVIEEWKDKPIDGSIFEDEADYIQFRDALLGRYRSTANASFNVPSRYDIEMLYHGSKRFKDKTAFLKLAGKHLGYGVRGLTNTLFNTNFEDGGEQTENSTYVANNITSWNSNITDIINNPQNYTQQEVLKAIQTVLGNAPDGTTRVITKDNVSPHNINQTTPIYQDGAEVNNQLTQEEFDERWGNDVKVVQELYKKLGLELPDIKKGDFKALNSAYNNGVEKSYNVQDYVMNPVFNTDDKFVYQPYTDKGRLVAGDVNGNNELERLKLQGERLPYFTNKYFTDGISPDNVESYQRAYNPYVQDLIKEVDVNPNLSSQQREEYKSFLSNQLFKEGVTAREFDKKYGNFTSSRPNVQLPYLTESERKKYPNLKFLGDAFDANGNIKPEYGDLSETTKSELQRVKATYGDDISNLGLTSYNNRDIFSEYTLKPADETGETTPYDKPTQQIGGVRTMMNQDGLPPDVLQPHFFNLPEIERISPIKVSPETAIRENTRVGNANRELISQNIGSQQGANIANTIGQQFDRNNKIVAQTNAQNAQYAQQANQVNLQQSNTEQQLRDAALQRHDNLQLTAVDKTNKDIRNYYNHLLSNRVNAMREMRNLNILDAIHPQFTFDQIGNVMYTPENETSVTITDPLVLKAMKDAGYFGSTEKDKDTKKKS